MASQCNLSTKDLTVIEDQLTHLSRTPPSRA